MSSLASAIERPLSVSTAELIAASSLEISPRELHRAADVAALLPKDSCVYIPSLPGLPLSRTLDAIASICGEKADHVRSTWADRALASAWNRNANKIAAVAAKLEATT